MWWTRTGFGLPFSRLLQSNCGCCWAFAGAEAASDRMCIATKAAMLFPLSAQDVCFNAFFGLYGCNGGQISTPWSYIKSKVSFRAQSNLAFLRASCPVHSQEPRIALSAVCPAPLSRAASRAATTTRLAHLVGASARLSRCPTATTMARRGMIRTPPRARPGVHLSRRLRAPRNATPRCCPLRKTHFAPLTPLSISLELPLHFP